MLSSKSRSEMSEKTRKRKKYTSLRRSNRVTDHKENSHKTITIRQEAHQEIKQQLHTPDMKAQTLGRSMPQLSLNRLIRESEATICRMLSAYYRTSRAHLQVQLQQLTPPKHWFRSFKALQTKSNRHTIIINNRYSSLKMKLQFLRDKVPPHHQPMHRAVQLIMLLDQAIARTKSIKIPNNTCRNSLSEVRTMSLRESKGNNLGQMAKRENQARNNVVVVRIVESIIRSTQRCLNKPVVIPMSTKTTQASVERTADR